MPKLKTCPWQSSLNEWGVEMYIKTDCAKLVKTAENIEAQIAEIRKHMANSSTAVLEMRSGFQGADYDAFYSKWDSLFADDSTYSTLVKRLESYAKFLRYAAEQYDYVQEQAQLRSNRIPKY
ncbi:MAG: hypothetical protein IKI97_11475 [Clostridia bacterium]|nr:hypothetical protein [Clostridia bacterium]